MRDDKLDNTLASVSIGKKKIASLANVTIRLNRDDEI